MYVRVFTIQFIGEKNTIYFDWCMCVFTIQLIENPNVCIYNTFHWKQTMYLFYKQNKDPLCQKGHPTSCIHNDIFMYLWLKVDSFSSFQDDTFIEGNHFIISMLSADF